MPTPSPNWSQIARSSSALHFHLLGMVDFDSGQRLQEQLLEELLARDDTKGYALFCEHPATVTIGRQGSRADLLAEPVDFTSREMPTQWLNRPGGTWVHTPGQLAAYVLLPIDRKGWSLLEYRTRLETALVGLATEFKAPALSHPESPGLAGRCGQFAFIGTGCRRGITHQGMFINVSIPPPALRLVDWGTHDGRVSTLAAHRRAPTALSSVREAFVRHLAAALDYPRYHLATGHPSLRRTVRKIYVFTQPAAHSA